MRSAVVLRCFVSFGLVLFGLDENYVLKVTFTDGQCVWVGWKLNVEFKSFWSNVLILDP